MMSHKKFNSYDTKYNKTENFNDSSNSSNSAYFNNISSEDKEALRLLSLQLRGIALDFYGEILFLTSTMQGISYILERYDNIEGNEHSTTLAPDVIALQSSYTFLAAKLIFINIAFTRFNIIYKKKEEGTFKYSLWPNYYINFANVLSLIVLYYYIRAAQGIVARDNTQPVFGGI